jgi:hypothetical protein
MLGEKFFLFLGCGLHNRSRNHIRCWPCLSLSLSSLKVDVPHCLDGWRESLNLLALLLIINSVERASLALVIVALMMTFSP